MKCTVSLFIALLLAAPVASASESRPTAADILSRIAKQGGDKVLPNLWESEDEFDQVLAGIESGDADWLEVASKLRPRTEDGASLAIDHAVAIALPKAPTRVLALVGRGFELEFICTSPFISPEPDVAEEYQRQTLTVLSQVTDPALKPLADTCADGVRLALSDTPAPEL